MIGKSSKNIRSTSESTLSEIFRLSDKQFPRLFVVGVIAYLTSYTPEALAAVAG